MRSANYLSGAATVSLKSAVSAPGGPAWVAVGETYYVLCDAPGGPILSHPVIAA